MAGGAIYTISQLHDNCEYAVYSVYVADAEYQEFTEQMKKYTHLVQRFDMSVKRKPRGLAKWSDKL